MRGSSDIVEGGRMALDNKTSLLNTQPPRAFSGPRTREYNPYPYSDTISAYDKSALKEAVFDDDIDQLRDGLYSFSFLHFVWFHFGYVMGIPYVIGNEMLYWN